MSGITGSAKAIGYCDTEKPREPVDKIISVEEFITTYEETVQLILKLDNGTGLGRSQPHTGHQRLYFYITFMQRVLNIKLDKIHTQFDCLPSRLTADTTKVYGVIGNRLPITFVSFQRIGEPILFLGEYLIDMARLTNSWPILAEKRNTIAEYYVDEDSFKLTDASFTDDGLKLLLSHKSTIVRDFIQCVAKCMDKIK